MNSQDPDNRPPAEAASRPYFLIVGVGASAGGLEAFSEFLDNVPDDSGMAFVLVQHLDPTHDSMLVELLARHTDLSIVTATDGAALAPGHIYVIPPDATLTLEHARLRLDTPAPARIDRRPIDTFFESLAADQGENAIGIVLAGTGSDGSRGITAIKNAGGLTLAQEAKTDDHEAMWGMPQSAAATGDVDQVLPVADIPAALTAYRFRRSGTPECPDASLDASPDDHGGHDEVAAYLDPISALLHERTGHDFSDYKDSTRIRRIQRRMVARDLRSVARYFECLRAEPGECEALFGEFLICVTQFFRDPEAWRTLADTVLPEILADKTAADSVRVWVAGCATGEEGYSIAIALAETLASRSATPTLQIFATDLDATAIQTARQGSYTSPLTGLSCKRTERWFTAENNGYRPIKAIRDSCIFSVHDLGRDPPFSRLDLIVCRNLLIYLRPDLHERILRKFHYGLKPGGYLFLGTSENVGHSSTLFATLDEKQRLFQRREATVSSPASFAVPGQPGKMLDSPLSSARARKSRHAAEQQIEREVRQAMAPYSPAYLVVDREYEILRFSGAAAGAYLEPTDGTARLNVFDMVKKTLRPAVRSAVQQAFSEQKPTIQYDLALSVAGQPRSITLITEPLPATNSHGRLCVVAFREGRSAEAETRAPAQPQRDLDDSATLENELHQTRARLRAAEAELANTQAEAVSANEEYQSVNEELQSSNEELETSKEEMQSINEELQTVNAELSDKNERLIRVNSDLQNLLESTQVATIFLDQNLCIKNFTPKVVELFHLRDSDTGRPLTDITSRLEYETLEQDVNQVLESLRALEREVKLDDDTTFIMSIRPYRTATGGVDGVIITFFDITERKHDENRRRAWLAAIVESSYDAIITQNTAGAITSWNAAAERIFGYSAEQVLGRSLHPLLARDEHAATPGEIGARQPGAQAAQADVTWLRKDGRAVDLALTVSPVVAPRGETVATSVIARDISERVAQEAHRELLVGELSHRVKNTLAIVQSIMTQTINQAASPERFREAFSKRIQALAQTHNLLSRSEWAGVEVKELIEKELRPYGDSAWRARGARVWLAPSQAIALGLALHELATNAAKHGALSHAEGQVAVAWERLDHETPSRLRLSWTEYNGPAIDAPVGKGFGLRLIKDGLAHQLDADVRLDFARDGLRCIVEFILNVAEPASD